jgi:hypothetical protein
MGGVLGNEWRSLAGFTLCTAATPEFQLDLDSPALWCYSSLHSRYSARTIHPEVARRSASSTDKPSTVAMSTTRCAPSVNVPVLSNTTAVRFRASSTPRPVAHEQSIARTHGGGDGDDQRHRQTERVGTRDDQHGHHAFDRERRIAANPQPHHKRENPGGSCDDGCGFRNF